MFAKQSIMNLQDCRNNDMSWPDTPYPQLTIIGLLGICLLDRSEIVSRKLDKSQLQTKRSPVNVRYPFFLVSPTEDAVINLLCLPQSRHVWFYVFVGCKLGWCRVWGGPGPMRGPRSRGGAGRGEGGGGSDSGPVPPWQAETRNLANMWHSAHCSHLLCAVLVVVCVF